MDYSLIVGIHDCDREDQDLNDPAQQNSESDEPVSGEEDNDGIDYDEQVPDIGGFAPTPPDSPQPNHSLPAFSGEIDPNFEKFGVKSSDG